MTVLYKGEYLDFLSRVFRLFRKWTKNNSMDQITVEGDNLLF